MLKNITVTVSLGVILFSLPVFVLAQNATTSPRTKLLNRVEEVRSKVDTRLASTTKKIEESRARVDAYRASTTERINDQRERIDTRLASTTERIAERRGRLDERRQENIRRASKYMTERFEAAIERIERLIERIEDRIAEWKREGKDINTTEEERYLAEAKTTLGTAQTSLRALKAKIEELVTAEDPQTLMPEIRTLSQVVVSDIKKSHGLVIQAIRNLKSANSTN